MSGKKLTSAEWVKAVRDRLGLTQDKFAERVGVGRNAVAKWETDVLKPRYASIEKIRAVAPIELRDVGLIQDDKELEDVPRPDGSFRSLTQAIDAWADLAGVKRPTEDNEFFDRLVIAWAAYLGKVAKPGQ